MTNMLDCHRCGADDASTYTVKYLNNNFTVLCYNCEEEEKLLAKLEANTSYNNEAAKHD